jgi:hypothetical protein
MPDLSGSWGVGMASGTADKTDAIFGDGTKQAADGVHAKEDVCRQQA